MGLGTSLFLIAAGAVLRWVVNVTNSSLNLQTIGLILLILLILLIRSPGGARGFASASTSPGASSVVQRRLDRDPAGLDRGARPAAGLDAGYAQADRSAFRESSPESPEAVRVAVDRRPVAGAVDLDVCVEGR